jgi:DNA topoisomerase-1
VATRKKKNLVIVESPAKAKTINKYLGPNFTVLASYGHIRDLPRGRRARGEAVVGINIDAGWVPRYVVEDDKDGHGKRKGRRTPKDILAELGREADKAGLVYLATDPDREGEAIAWHLKEALELPDDRIMRVTFNEITKGAVQEAFQHASAIDMNRVAAQEARRFLDRVVGYKLSPLLDKKVTRGLSAGRVQSVAVRLIVEREREIENFKEEEYWKVNALLAPQGTRARPRALEPRKVLKQKGDTPPGGEEGEEVVQGLPEVPDGAFLAELAEWNGKKFKAANAAAVDEVLAALRGAAYVVSKIEQKDRPEKAPAPFTTSTLQQQASIRLHFTARRTMTTASACTRAWSWTARARSP